MNLLGHIIIVMLFALPFSARAESSSDVPAAQPTMHFMKLPPRKMQGQTLAQRGQFTSLNSIARQQARPTAQLREQPSKDQPPNASDPNKLLLYVYDEMR